METFDLSCLGALRAATAPVAHNLPLPPTSFLFFRESARLEANITNNLKLSYRLFFLPASPFIHSAPFAFLLSTHFLRFHNAQDKSNDSMPAESGANFALGRKCSTILGRNWRQWAEITPFKSPKSINECALCNVMFSHHSKTKSRRLLP